jgi:hypothetical protein
MDMGMGIIIKQNKEKEKDHYIGIMLSFKQ